MYQECQKKSLSLFRVDVSPHTNLAIKNFEIFCDQVFGVLILLFPWRLQFYCLSDELVSPK